MDKENLISEMRAVADGYVRDLIDEVPQAEYYLLENDIAENLSMSMANAAMNLLPQWVKVEDGLPEIPKPYFSEEYGGMITPCNVTVLVYDGENVYGKTYGITKWDDDITHWQPLPEPPKE